MRRALTGLIALALIATPTIAAGSPDPESPRVLILALDGVPYRAVKQAQQQGAFAGWPDAKPLISTFPSMTNIAYTALLRPFGVEPISGYELRHFDTDRNKMIGGLAKYKKRAYAWRDSFQITSRTNGSKIAVYARPVKHAWKMVAEIERLVLESPDELIFVHVASTDPMAHFSGDEKVVPFLLELSPRLEELERRHRESRGRPLRLVLLSDHGNSDQKVIHVKGIRKQLRAADLRVVSRLKRPNDVVNPTFGIVNFGLLFLRPELAEQAARAVADHPAVDVAAWLSAEREIRVISGDGDAVIRWRGEVGARRLAYEPSISDPLRLAEVRAGMAEAGLFDEDRYATEADWFEHSALSDFPDAPRRLVDSLTGTYVRNAATVIFSLETSYGMGLFSARLGAGLKGGQKGTHGGLDRSSSLGFFLTNDPADRPRVAVRADQALIEWATGE
jgi:hypothetical protein